MASMNGRTGGGRVALSHYSHHGPLPPRLLTLNPDKPHKPSKPDKPAKAYTHHACYCPLLHRARGTCCQRASEAPPQPSMKETSCSWHKGNMNLDALTLHRRWLYWSSMTSRG